MYFIRFLILILAVWALIMVARRLLERPKQSKRAEPQPVADDDMVKCAHCGVHIPAAEAVRDGGSAYCSDRHRLAGKRD